MLADSSTRMRLRVSGAVTMIASDGFSRKSATSAIAAARRISTGPCSHEGRSGLPRIARASVRTPAAAATPMMTVVGKTGSKGGSVILFHANGECALSVIGARFHFVDSTAKRGLHRADRRGALVVDLKNLHARFELRFACSVRGHAHHDERALTLAEFDPRKRRQLEHPRRLGIRIRDRFDRGG